MKDLQWFLDRVESFVLRGANDIYIKDAKMAEELWKLQSDSYSFSDKVRVHRAPVSACLSCEG